MPLFNSCDPFLLLIGIAIGLLIGWIIKKYGFANKSHFDSNDYCIVKPTGCLMEMCGDTDLCCYLDGLTVKYNDTPPYIFKAIGPDVVEVTHTPNGGQLASCLIRITDMKFSLAKVLLTTERIKGDLSPSMNIIEITYSLPRQVAAGVDSTSQSILGNIISNAPRCGTRIIQPPDPASFLNGMKASVDGGGINKTFSVHLAVSFEKTGDNTLNITVNEYTDILPITSGTTASFQITNAKPSGNGATINGTLPDGTPILFTVSYGYNILLIKNMKNGKATSPGLNLSQYPKFMKNYDPNL